MFDIGWSELLLIAAVTIIVVGPKELPNLLRNIGQIINKLKSMTNEVRTQFDEALQDNEISKMRSDIEDIKNGNFTSDNMDLDQAFDEHNEAIMKDSKVNGSEVHGNKNLKEQEIKENISDNQVSESAKDHPVLQDENQDLSSEVSLKENRA